MCTYVHMYVYTVGTYVYVRMYVCTCMDGSILCFIAILQTEGKLPHELAIDRPSIKFLSFLRRHYSLCSHPKQVSTYVFTSACQPHFPITRVRIYMERHTYLCIYVYQNMCLYIIRLCVYTYIYMYIRTYM